MTSLSKILLLSCLCFVLAGCGGFGDKKKTGLSEDYWRVEVDFEIKIPPNDKSLKLNRWFIGSFKENGVWISVYWKEEGAKSLMAKFQVIEDDSVGGVEYVGEFVAKAGVKELGRVRIAFRQGEAPQFDVKDKRNSDILYSIKIIESQANKFKIDYEKYSTDGITKQTKDAINLKDVKALYDIGVHLWTMGNRKKAIEVWKKASEIDPEYEKLLKLRNGREWNEIWIHGLMAD